MGDLTGRVLTGDEIDTLLELVQTVQAERDHWHSVADELAKRLGGAPLCTNAQCKCMFLRQAALERWEGLRP